MNTPEQQLSDSLLAACKAAGIESPRFIAQDANGHVIHYDEKPSREGWAHIWGNGGPFKRLNHPPYADDWQSSLMEWVDHVADTSKKINDACKVAYHAHLEKDDGTCWSRYRQGWQDALEWKAMAEEGGASE
jgi:hypothetical protein